MDKLMDQLNNIELYFNDFQYLDNSEIMKNLYLLTINILVMKNII